MNDTGTVYLIHLDQKICHAQHYIGYTRLDSVEQRLNRHKSGSGARFLQYANQIGVNYSIVKTWTFSNWKSARAFERKLKSQKHAPRLCPVCNQHLCNQENLQSDFLM